MTLKLSFFVQSKKFSKTGGRIQFSVTGPVLLCLLIKTDLLITMSGTLT